MSGRFRMNEGDWVCVDPQCGNVNFARRLSCNRCGKEKTESSKKKKLGTEIGKVAAEKSRGLFSADDWQCNKCGNVNWARRQHCNMCNAPKYGEVEERTGYGGGYNERENVEYIEREESDGEYDEFGRKKKKFRGKLSSSSSSDQKTNETGNTSKNISESKHVIQQERHEEEEDEDDDEDEDLSKYDLSGWGDDEEESQTNNDWKKKDHAKSRSSSRSRSCSRSLSRSSSSRSRSPSRSSFSSRKRRHHSKSQSRSRSSSYDSRSSKRRRPRSRSRSRSGSQDRSRSRSSSGERSQH